MVYLRAFSGLALAGALVVSCGPPGGGIRVNKDITENTTWTRAMSPVVVEQSINVQGTSRPTLTIDAGVIVRFKQGTGLSVGTSSQSGALRAVGTKNEPIIFTAENEQPQPGEWLGLSFGNNSDDARTRLENVQLSGSGGGDKGVAIDVQDALVDMINVAVNGSKGVGISFGGEAGFGLNSTAVTVHNAGSYGISIPANTASTVPKVGSSYLDNDAGAAELRGGVVTTTQTWRDIGAPWIVTDDIDVGGDASPILTLEANVRLRFAPGKAFTIGAGQESGGLRTQGSAGAEVVLTAASQTRGGWNGVIIQQASARLTSLSYTDIEYAGAATQKAALVINGSQPVLQNVAVRDSSTDGIAIISANVAIVPEFGAGSTAIVSKSNTGVGLRIPANAIGTVPADGCDFGGNGVSGVLVENGLVRRTQTWQAINVPYEFATNLSIGQSTVSDTVLTLQPGVRLAFRPGYEIAVGASNARGSLRALGQPTNKVILTVPGADPVAGDWLGLHFYPSAIGAGLGTSLNRSLLQETEIRFGGVGGATPRAAFQVDALAARPVLDNVTVKSSAGYGACITGENALTLYGNEITIENSGTGSFCP
jgi:hypothetical protein